jgi:hypothetical protein
MQRRGGKREDRFKDRGRVKKGKYREKEGGLAGKKGLFGRTRERVGVELEKEYVK